MEKVKNKSSISKSSLKSEENGKIDKDNNEKEKKKEEKINTGIKVAEISTNFVGNIVGKIIDYFTTKQKIINESKPNEDLNEKINKQNEEINELTKKLEKMYEDKKLEKQSLIDAKKEWNEAKNNLINIMFNNIDQNLIKNIIKEYIENLEKDIINEIDKIFIEELKNNNIINEKYNYIYKIIKNDIPEIKTYNFMLIGFTGAGKSCLTNAILKSQKAIEGHGIKPKTDKIEQFSSKEMPGITIYDTIGIESTSIDRGLEKIKEKVEKTFIESLDTPQNSLHGILYCINNGSSATRIEDGEINFILELNKLYGENDILIIVFTQSISSITEERKQQLRDALKNDKIEIIEVLAKDQKLKIGKKEQIIEAYGIDDLITQMKTKCKNKLVKCNLKQIVKKKINDKFFNMIDEKYKAIENKLKSNNFENSFKEECNLIVNEFIGNLNLNFKSLENILLEYISNNKLNDIKNKILEENISKFYKGLFEGFNSINEKYGNILTNFSINEINNKFDEYFTSNIKNFIINKYFEEAGLIFNKKCKEFFGELIGKNIKDEDIEELVNSNVDDTLKLL